MQISSEVTNKEIETAFNSKENIKVYWGIISSLEGDKEFQREIDKIKFGIKIKFDIRAVTQGEYERKPEFKVVWIRRKLHIPIEDFDDELEERMKIMKNILRELYDESFDNQGEQEIKGYD